MLVNVFNLSTYLNQKDIFLSLSQVKTILDKRFNKRLSKLKKLDINIYDFERDEMEAIESEAFQLFNKKLTISERWLKMSKLTEQDLYDVKKLLTYEFKSLEDIKESYKGNKKAVKNMLLLLQLRGEIEKNFDMRFKKRKG